nr:hypothetical protein [uncultured Ruminococcus sp.]
MANFVNKEEEGKNTFSSEIVIDRRFIADIVRTTLVLNNISLLFYDDIISYCKYDLLKNMYDAQYEILEHYLKSMLHIPSKVYANDDYESDEVNLFDNFLSPDESTDDESKNYLYYNIFDISRDDSIDNFVREYLAMIKRHGYKTTQKITIENSYKWHTKKRVVLDDVDVLDTKSTPSAKKIIIDRKIIKDIVKTALGLNKINLFINGDKDFDNFLTDDYTLGEVYNNQIDLLEIYLESKFDIFFSKVYDNFDYFDKRLALFKSVLLSKESLNFKYERIDKFIENYLELIKDCGYKPEKPLIIENTYN